MKVIERTELPTHLPFTDLLATIAFLKAFDFSEFWCGVAVCIWGILFCICLYAMFKVEEVSVIPNEDPVKALKGKYFS